MHPKGSARAADPPKWQNHLNRLPEPGSAFHEQGTACGWCSRKCLHEKATALFFMHKRRATAPFCMSFSNTPPGWGVRKGHAEWCCSPTFLYEKKGCVLLVQTFPAAPTTGSPLPMKIRARFWEHVWAISPFRRVRSPCRPLVVGN